MVEKLDEMNTEKKNIPHITEEYDVVVVGAGHAGCEAALASARLGLETIMFTVSVDSIALMPCNPNIGGSSKGHLVREIDALGEIVHIESSSSHICGHQQLGTMMSELLHGEVTLLL